MAKVPNDETILPNVSMPQVGAVGARTLQTTDRQTTDGFAIAMAKRNVSRSAKNDMLANLVETSIPFPI